MAIRKHYDWDVELLDADGKTHLYTIRGVETREKAMEKAQRQHTRGWGRGKAPITWTGAKTTGNPNPAAGVRFVLGIAGRGAQRVSEVQSVLFARARYTIGEARRWLEQHGFRAGAVDEGGERAEYLRFRQTDPEQYHTMRTMTPGRENPATSKLRLEKDSTGLWWIVNAQGERIGGPYFQESDAKRGLKAWKTGLPIRVRTNPSAAALSEEFHGRPVRHVTTIADADRYRRDLADLGWLQEIVMRAPRGVKIGFDRRTRLCANAEGTQLYIVGGDQAVNPEDFDADPSKELVTLGPVKLIVYVTDKQHLGEEDKRPGPYTHKLGEEGGEMPMLVYDTLNRELLFSGGDYHLKDAAAGIRN